MTAPRHIVRFESLDGSTIVTLPPDRAEVESTQAARLATVPTVGADYALDLFGVLPAPLDVGVERHRAWLYGASAADLEAQIDAMRAAIADIGRGRLVSVGADGSERWAEARAAAMPDITLGATRSMAAPCVLEFRRYTDWLAADPTIVELPIAASPASIPVVNDGSTAARAIVIRLTATAAGGFNHPAMSNPLTGESWSSSRVAGASGILEIDTGRWTVRYSADAGVTWQDDYAGFSTGGTQVGFLRLIPGAQTLALTGVTAATVRMTFSAPYR